MKNLYEENGNKHEHENLQQENLEVEGLLDALKEKETELEELKLKTEFFSNISHEFKTPLNVLIGAIQVIELYTSSGTIIDPDEKLKKYIKTMKQNAYRLLRLINNLINLSKIDSNYMELQMNNYDIIHIIDGIISSVDMYAKEKSVSIRFDKEFDRKVIACDADKLEKIIINLLSNALKFANENGNIKVSVEEKPGVVCIIVEDDGIGIPKDKQIIIFNRFRQVESSYTRNKQGSGIGLSLVKALVELHHGEIRVESEYEKGSKFIVELPAVILEDEADRKFHMYFEDSRDERIRIELSDL
jgi:signal transduction histidine kinase